MLRRIARVIAIVVLAPLAIGVGVVALTACALQTARGRELLRVQANKLVSDALGARFEIARLDSASLFYLRGSGLRLARGSARVVEVPRFALRFDPFALIAKRVAVTAAWLDHPYVDLGAPLEQGGGGLLGLLQENAQHTSPGPKPAAQSSSGLVFAFQHMRVSAGQIDARLSGAQFSVTRLVLQGGIEIGDKITGAVGFIAFDVLRDGASVGSLRGSRLRYKDGPEVAGRLRIRTQHGELAAAVELGPPRALAARRVKAELYARAIAPDDLSALGLDASWLKAPIDLACHAAGTTRDADFDATLTSEGGALRLAGKLSEAERVVARLDSDGLDTRRVLRDGFAPLSLALELEAKFANDFRAVEFGARLLHGRYAGALLPVTELNGAWNREDGLALDRLHARYPEAGAELLAQARLRPNDELAATLSFHAERLERASLLRAFLPAVSGKLGARASLQRGASGAIKAQLELAADHFGFGAGTTDRLQINLRGEGSAFAALRANGELQATELRIARMRFAEASLHLQADPRRYLVKARFGRQGALELRADHVGAAWVANGNAQVDLGQSQALRLVIANARYAHETLDFGRTELAIGQARAKIAGTLQPEGQMRTHLALVVPDLAPLARLVTSEEVHGKIELDARASGATQRPLVTLNGHYSGARVLGLQNAEIGVQARAAIAQHTFDLSLRAEARNTSIRAELHSLLPRAELSQAALEGGKHDLTLEIGSLPLTELTPFPSARLRLASAELNGKVHLHGTLRDPTLELTLHSRAQFYGDRDRMRVDVSAVYDDSHAAIDLSTADAKGPLFHLGVKTQLEPHSAFARSVDDISRLLSQRSWQAEVWSKARRVDELPAVHAVEVQPALFPWQLELSAKFAHEPGEEPKGEFELKANFDATREPLHAARCGAAGNANLVLKAEMADGVLVSHTRVAVAEREMLTIATHSPAPLDQWLGPATPQPLDVDVQFDRLRFAALPLLCDEVDGELSGKIALKRAVTQQVTLGAQLHARNVSWGKAPKFDAYLEAHADRDQLRAKADLNGAGGSATLSAQLPLDIKARVPTVRMDAPATVEARLQEMSVAALLGGIPAVSAEGGRIDGVVKLSGALDDPHFNGELALRKVTVTLGKLGQRFEDVTGKLTLDDRRLRLAQTQVHDRGGRVKLTGEVILLARDRLHAEFEADAKSYPLRRDGVVLGDISGALRLKADVAPERTTLDLALHHAAIELPEEDFGNVQSLKPNPDVRYLDSRPDDPQLAADDGGETVIHIDASEPMWIRREDFAVEISTRMTVVSRGETPEITGTLKIERGTIELIGQIFDIERGSIEFAGGHTIEPTLDLTAKRSSPGGGSVTVQAQGRLHAPELTFLVDDRPAPAEQALAALSGGGGASSASLQDQLGSVATGMAAGVLTMGARRQFGDWVPMLSVESGATSTRLRAGVEARRLIPKFLRKVVVDAYVEGMVSSAQDPNETDSAAQQNAQTQAAVLLELRFPHSLIGEAQYGPGQRWSADLSFEP